MIIEHDEQHWEIRPERTTQARQMERRLLQMTAVGGGITTLSIGLVEPLLAAIVLAFAAMLVFVGRRMKVTVWIELDGDSLTLRGQTFASPLATRGRTRVVIARTLDGFGMPIDQWIWRDAGESLATARLAEVGWVAADLHRACRALDVPITRDPEQLTRRELGRRYPLAGGPVKPWKIAR